MTLRIISACGRDRPGRRDSSVFQAAPLLARPLARQAAAAAQRPPLSQGRVALLAALHLQKAFPFRREGPDPILREQANRGRPAIQGVEPKITARMNDIEKAMPLFETSQPSGSRSRPSVRPQPEH